MNSYERRASIEDFPGGGGGGGWGWGKAGNTAKLSPASAWQ